MLQRICCEGGGLGSAPQEDIQGWHQPAYWISLGTLLGTFELWLLSILK